MRKFMDFDNSMKDIVLDILAVAVVVLAGITLLFLLVLALIEEDILGIALGSLAGVALVVWALTRIVNY